MKSPVPDWKSGDRHSRTNRKTSFFSPTVSAKASSLGPSGLMTDDDEADDEGADVAGPLGRDSAGSSMPRAEAGEAQPRQAERERAVGVDPHPHDRAPATTGWPAARRR